MVVLAGVLWFREGLGVITFNDMLNKFTVLQCLGLHKVQGSGFRWQGLGFRV